MYFNNIYVVFFALKKTPMKFHRCFTEQKLISLGKLPVEHIFLYL